MRPVCLTVCFLLIFSLLHADHCIVSEGRFFRLVNTHSFGKISGVAPYNKCYVAADRDLTMVCVKDPSNLILSVKSPSLCRVGQKIKLKIGEKEIVGKIILTDEQYFEIDIPIEQGNSGAGVFDHASGALIGLLSHYFVKNNKQHSRIVRIDNIVTDDMQEMNAVRLLTDWEYFNSIKNYEYTILREAEDVLIPQKFKNFLQKNPPPVQNHIWKSLFLKKETQKSENIINNIYKRIVK